MASSPIYEMEGFEIQTRDDPLSQDKAGIKVNFLVHLQSFTSTIFSTSKMVRSLANSFPLSERHRWF